MPCPFDDDVNAALRDAAQRAGLFRARSSGVHLWSLCVHSGKRLQMSSRVESLSFSCGADAASARRPIPKPDPEKIVVTILADAAKRCFRMALFGERREYPMTARHPACSGESFRMKNHFPSPERRTLPFAGDAPADQAQALPRYSARLSGARLSGPSGLP